MKISASPTAFTHAKLVCCRSSVGSYLSLEDHMKLFRRDRRPENLQRKVCSSKSVKYVQVTLTDWTYFVRMLKTCTTLLLITVNLDTIF